MNLEELTERFDIFKIAIVGDRGVGKTSLFLKFVENRHTSCNPLTIHVDSEFKMICPNEKSIALQIWDAPGFASFKRAIHDSSPSINSSRIAYGIIIVYDCTDYKSFENVTYWISMINHNFSDNVPKLLVGNKRDSSDRRVIDCTLGKELADEMQIPFIETYNDTSEARLAFKMIFRAIFCKKQQEIEVRKETDEQENDKKTECQERKDRKYSMELIIPILESISKILPSLEALSVNWAAENDLRLPEKKKTDSDEHCEREIEKFNCKGTMEDISKRWKIWKRDFELYTKAKDVTDDGRKTAALLHYAGQDTQEIYFSLLKENENKLETCELPKECSKTAIGLEDEKILTEYERAMNLLDNYFLLEENSLYERIIFRKMKQNVNETIEQYAIRLREQARYCDFENDNILEEHIRDQIVATSESTRIKNKFLEEGASLTLQRLLKMCESFEMNIEDNCQQSAAEDHIWDDHFGIEDNEEDPKGEEY